MEVVEHVADVGAFLRASADLVRPGVVMILATLNRTPKAFLMAIVGAEYLLRWLPRGTHDWRRFLRPSELAHALRGTGLQIEEVTGVAYNPPTRSEEHTSELQSLMRISYAVFCLKKKTN